MADKSPLEEMVTIQQLRPYYAGKKVFLTGHTGFKGAWLLQILKYLGAEVAGYSLAPAHDYDLFHEIGGAELTDLHFIADIRDKERLKSAMLDFQPDYVFHLAAQPLVLKGYEDPLYTYEVNTLGTAYLLDALRFLKKKCTAIMITTDKVYENNDDNRLFSEEDKLGGYDPYSASKAACELIISSYRNSYFNNQNYDSHHKSITSVRAGNVIGGGDYSDNRIIPDLVRSIKKDKKVILRNPSATRPWQHVLEPLCVYLLLGTKMQDEPTYYNTCFNIGPEQEDVLSVEELTRIAFEVAKSGSYEIEENVNKPHEAATLMLDISKVKSELLWTPQWNARQAIAETMDWYMSEEDATTKCLKQIKKYFNYTINDSEED